MADKRVLVGCIAVVVLVVAALVVAIYFSVQPSDEDLLPITGLSQPKTLIPCDVIPCRGKNFTLNHGTTMVLRDDWFSWSAKDQSVFDVMGKKWFDIDCTAFSTTDSCDMKLDGQTIASYLEKFWTTHDTRYITIPKNGKVHVVATVMKAAYMQWDNNAHVYLHEPTVSYDDVSSNGLGDPYIEVLEYDGFKGWDDSRYNYVTKDPDTNKRIKIAESSRSWRDSYVQDTYYLTVGRNVDLAFMTLVQYAVKDMFDDGDKRKKRSIVEETAKI